MSSIDQQFVEYIVKSLVSKPDAVKIDRRIDEKGVLLELTVDPEDLGRVIGKRGGTAQSLRILLRALGTKNDARYNLKIIDNGYPKPQRDESYRNTSAAPTDEPAGIATTTDEPPVQDQPATDEPVADEPVQEESTSEETEEVKPEKPSEPEASETQPSTPTEEDSSTDRESVASKTRRELEDLDDLDI